MTEPAWRTPPAGAACGLLISVRDAEEAREALAGGATIIDVKEPLRGPLGRADATVAAAIAAVVAARSPWTLACGELATGLPDVRDHLARVLAHLSRAAVRPAAVKVGLAGLAARDWPALLAGFGECLPEGIEPVAVAYADWRAAAAPDPAAVIEAAAGLGFRMLLIDTCGKASPGLLEGPAAVPLAGWVAAARRAGLGVALAGRLTEDSIPKALEFGPDVLGFRSAGCVGGRFGAVSGKLVRRLGKLCGVTTGEPSAQPSGVQP